MDKGKVIIFSAPSGAGKTTIVRELMKTPELVLEFSVSATNRPLRGSEQNGIDYHFLSTEDFIKKINHSEFLEWEEVYEGRYYGTLKSEVDRIRNAGKNAIFDIDVKGGINLKEYFQDLALSVFVMPPSIDELESRLRNRGTDDEESIRKRLKRAEFEMSLSNQFDKVLINDNLAESIDSAKTFVSSFLSESR